MKPTQRGQAVVVLSVVLLAVALGASGCSRFQSPGLPAALSQSAAPAPADLSSPHAAVVSYLDWTSYAYAVGNSDVATATMSPREEVRVNSYVELNRERHRRIAQVLTSFRPRAASVDASRATVGADEVWEYRYVSTDGAKAISETYTASYETTYHVVLVGPATWVVDSVEARSLGKVE